MALSSFVNLHPGVLFYNVIQILTICGIHKGEIDKPMPYSKFASTGSSSGGKSPSMVSSKSGMLIIYVPATIVAFIFQFILPQVDGMDYYPTPTVAGLMVFAQFFKRDLEVLFLHKYSGETESNAAGLIGVSYALVAFMICLLSNPGNLNSGSSKSRMLGMLLFVIGSLGNFYHHYLLALLRSDSPSKGNSTASKKIYKAPNGGLFTYVATPHYLFELVAWLGISMASQQLTSYLNFVSMTCYLSARAYNQNQWNKKKFDEKDWPSSRKNLVPFLY